MSIHSQEAGEKRIFVVGNSHTSAMSRALEAFEAPVGIDLKIANINKVWDRLNSPKTPNLAALMCALYREAMGRKGADLIVARLGGNEHSVLATLESEQPFDFILPERADLPILPDRQFVTHGFVKAIMHRKVHGALRHLAPVRQTIGVPLVVVEAPPPIPDDSYVAKVLDKFFETQSTTTTISPAALRWKMWRVQSEVTRDIATQSGAMYLPTPDSVFDADGYLAKNYWGNDATHGNTAYGQVMNEAVANHCMTQFNEVACDV